MKGRKDQSLSAAGSVSSSTPNQLSISGPLINSHVRDKGSAACFRILPRVVEAHDTYGRRKATIWPHLEALVVDLLASGRVYVPKLFIRGRVESW